MHGFTYSRSAACNPFFFLSKIVGLGSCLFVPSNMKQFAWLHLEHSCQWSDGKKVYSKRYNFAEPAKLELVSDEN